MKSGVERITEVAFKGKGEVVSSKPSKVKLEMGKWWVIMFECYLKR